MYFCSEIEKLAENGVAQFGFIYLSYKWCVKIERLNNLWRISRCHFSHDARIPFPVKLAKESQVSVAYHG